MYLVVMTYVVATNCNSSCGTSCLIRSLQFVFWPGWTEKSIRCENLLKVTLCNGVYKYIYCNAHDAAFQV